jgi:hypothetical protein
MKEAKAARRFDGTIARHELHKRKTSKPMPEQILDIVLNAQNGGALTAAGRLAGMTPEEARVACRRLVPEIAGLARGKAETDQEAYDELVDLIEDDSTAAVLDDPAVLGAPETTADGDDILAALYGSAEQAKASAGKAGPMMPVLAVLTLAAIARRGRAAMMGVANVRIAPPAAGFSAPSSRPSSPAWSRA